MAKHLSAEQIYQVLRERNLLDEAQVREIKGLEGAQRKRLFRARRGQKDKEEESRHRDEDITLVEIIASLGLKAADDQLPLTEERIMRALADWANLPFVKIDPLKLDLDLVTTTIPKPFAKKHLVVPLVMDDGQLMVAMANPWDLETLDTLKRTSRLKIKPVVATKTDVLKTIIEFFGFKSSLSLAEKELTAPVVDIGNLEQFVKLKSVQEIEATDQHIVNAVDYLLHYALDQRASDIHIEPKRNFSLVRFRIDGMLHSIHTMPKTVHPAITSRVKMVSRLDIAEKRRPQDGRIKVEHQGREIEIRVSTLPVAFGEKSVLRIFDPEVLMQDLSDLGFSAQDLLRFKSFIARPHGIILVTGPTGSGKTTTLYSSLKLLATGERNVTTIEDPVEMICEDYNQISVQPQIGVTFASSLRTVLRQDPDVIMVGEVRDQETADNAVQAALTGHLVFSTLHTNDASSSVTRLQDLGVPSFLISTAVIGIIAQRLVRKICPHCEEEYEANGEQLRTLGLSISAGKETPPPGPLPSIQTIGMNPASREGGNKAIFLKRGRGCPQCRGTGYYKRIGIYEVMAIDEKIRPLINAKANAQEIKKAAREEGMTTLYEGAIRKMLKGITTYEEVLRVTGVE